MTDKELLNHIAVVSSLLGDLLLAEVCKAVADKKKEFTIAKYIDGEYHLKIRDDSDRLVNRIINRYTNHDNIIDTKWRVWTISEYLQSDSKYIDGYAFKITHLKELIDLNKKGD